MLVDAGLIVNFAWDTPGIPGAQRIPAGAEHGRLDFGARGNDTL